MSKEKKFKISSIIVMIIACVALVERMIGLNEQNQAIEEMNKVGWAVHINPDSLQRDMRLILALIFVSITLWSNRAVKIALASYTTLYLIIEALFLGGLGFDRVNLEVHLLVGCSLATSIYIYYEKFYVIPGISL